MENFQRTIENPSANRIPVHRRIKYGSVHERIGHGGTIGKKKNKGKASKLRGQLFDAKRKIEMLEKKISKK